VQLDNQETLDLLGPQVHSGHLATLETQAVMVYRDQLEQQVHKGHLDLQDSLALMAALALADPLDRMELLVLPDLMVQLVPLDRLVPLVTLVQMD